MVDVKAGRISDVVMFDISRLSREMMHGLEIMSVFQNNNVVVHTPDKGVIKFTDAKEKFSYIMSMYISEIEIEQNRDAS